MLLEKRPEYPCPPLYASDKRGYFYEADFLMTWSGMHRTRVHIHAISVNRKALLESGGADF